MPQAREYSVLRLNGVELQRGEPRGNTAGVFTSAAAPRRTPSRLARIDPDEHWLEVGHSQFDFLAGGLLRSCACLRPTLMFGFPTVSVVANSASAHDVEFGAFHATVGA